MTYILIQLALSWHIISWNGVLCPGMYFGFLGLPLPPFFFLYYVMCKGHSQWPIGYDLELVEQE